MLIAICNLIYALPVKQRDNYSRDPFKGAIKNKSKHMESLVMDTWIKVKRKAQFQFYGAKGFVKCEKLLGSREIGYCLLFSLYCLSMLFTCLR